LMASQIDLLMEKLHQVQAEIEVELEQIPPDVGQGL
jgi:hypothetical protein